MGNMCSKRTATGTEAGTTYEGLCSAVESKLGLHNIEITEFESVLDEVSYKKSAISINTLSDVFYRFGISREEFMAKENPFLIFYNGLVGTFEEDKGYILSTSLPFCKGKIFDKKSVLWGCLTTTEKNYINYKELLGLINMLIVVSVKVIPEIAVETEEKNIDQSLQMLIDATEEDVDYYSKFYYPNSPREGDAMHRHEFDNWFVKPETEGIFSPKRHRKAFLTYLNSKKIPKVLS